MRRDRRAPLGGVLVAAALLVVAVAVPSTSGAFTAAIDGTRDSAAVGSRFDCTDTFAGEPRHGTAYFELSLTEPADATVAEDSSAAGDPGDYLGGHGSDERAGSACPADAGAAYRLDGTTSGVSTGRRYPPVTGPFSEEIWFRTTSPGKLMGFEFTADRASGNYDKHLYVDTSGRLVFGVYDAAARTTRILRTAGAVTDDAWHQAVGVVSDAGGVLYLDGAQAAADSTMTSAEDYSGYWRIGFGQLGNWPGTPGITSHFRGSLRFAAAYPWALTARDVATAWDRGRP